MPQQCPEYAIGDTLANLRDVTWYGIPYPVTGPFVPYAVVRKCGNMREKGFGFPTVTWEFSSLSQPQLDSIFSFFAYPTDASVEVYIRTYKDVGTLRETGVYCCWMNRPVDGNGLAVVTRSRFWYRDISVRFTHLVEQ